MKKRPSWLAARDATLFFAGLMGVAHETLLTSQDRPDLLILYAAMMGLPAFLEGDRRRRISESELRNGKD